jgi:hypothetical protein
MPKTAAEIPFDMLPQLRPMLLRRTGTPDNVQGREHCLGGARL